MRIVIDMQGAQTESRFRGIGRYTLSFTQAIVRNRGEHEIIIALSGQFPETIEPLRASFDGLLPQENIRVWHAPSPVKEGEPGNTLRRESAELIREAFLASLRPDVVHITSMFEGYVDDAVTSIARFDQTTPVSVTLYDLIPLLNPDQYLKPDPAYKQCYQRKITHLRQASLLLAISESSRQEAIDHLDVPKDSVTNISTAADAHFRPITVSAEQKQALQEKYGISRPFVMYTGGADCRKNIDGLIRAYALLPDTVRVQHQLLVVCPMHPQDRLRLETLGKKKHLAHGELVLTGFVPEDDLLLLYNLCKMFVFPSWHEGFGLPALEAMACGRAVIGSNTSSLPEVIGREDALFDSRSDASIAEKIEQVLTDEGFRTTLEHHGVAQAQLFSWDISARRALAALEKHHAQQSVRSANIARLMPPSAPKLKLAYVSPLPPERSGISDYSAELLPALARHYDIDVIVAQDQISDPWIAAHCPARSVAWFLDNDAQYDRVFYHVGNSPYHQHMFNLLEQVPGVVVLHDFFLSSIMAYMDSSGDAPGSWAKALYQSHGYAAVRHRFHADDAADVVYAYPCNLSVLQNAKGTIVHSDPSRRLFQQWYGRHAADDCTTIPLVRAPRTTVDRGAARRALKLDDQDFVVCSFGMLAPTKLNHRLLDSWLASELAHDAQCILVFVGENHQGEYGRALRDTIRKSKFSTQIRITDWVDSDTFHHFLAAADVGVQLRSLSRGETSAAVLDCMNVGLPTIINAHGSLADLPDDGTWKLPDNFSDTELVDALETLWRDKERRSAIGKQALHILRTSHAPEHCAALYATAIEKFYRASATGITGLTAALTDLLPRGTTDQALTEIAGAIAHSIPAKLTQPQLLVDISTVVHHDDGTGIPRVVRSILSEWLTHPPQGYRVEPVYATEQHGYRYARQYTLGFLDCPTSALSDDLVEFTAGDQFIVLDLQHYVVMAQENYYREMRRQGVRVQFLVYDLLPVLMPHYFIEPVVALHPPWLEIVADSDGVICISKAVADEFVEWEKTRQAERLRPLDVSWFHLGSDVKASVPTKGLPDSAVAVLKSVKESHAFLMIGTVEPRKGHAQVLAAFEQLWATGLDAMLVIVGRPGWMVEPLAATLRGHLEFGKRLIWLEGISDEYLEEIYARGTCLIAASAGEGFGLPLIEAAQHKLPIIARDIPVFREVAGEHAFYFSGNEPSALTETICDWLQHYESNTYPKSDSLPWLTWKQSASQLLKLVLQDPSYRAKLVSPTVRADECGVGSATVRA